MVGSGRQALRRTLSLPCLALLLSLATLLGGCAGGAARESARVTETRNALVLDALGQIGRPYRYGGTSPQGFDCSGLVQYVYAQSGIKLPRTTTEQLKYAKRIKLAEARAGDLLFYSFSGRSGVDHVAVYLGDGRAVHAPSSGRQVIVARVDSPSWQSRFRSAGTILQR